jgi:sigma-B regulation protein RsbU (phosphoserine phosphatase)
MTESEKEQILKVLSGAILRETTAFNFYSKGSEDEGMPPSIRGLLSRLAEEERRHRHLLLNEYFAVERGWGLDRGKEERGLSYQLPDELPFLSLSVAPDLDAVALSLPSRLVGGDNVFSSVLADHAGSPTGTILFLYDVMGHSVATTEINALAAKIVGEYFDTSVAAKMETELFSPKRIVRLLNKSLHERYEDQGVFLTMICVYFDCDSGTMTYVCAGHEPPFLLHEAGHVGSLLHTQLIVGIDPDFPYREHKVPFADGDVLCLFSDGIVEAKNQDGTFFGREGVASVLEKHWNAAPQRIIQELLEAMTSHLAGKPIEDEVSIVVIRAKGV